MKHIVTLFFLLNTFHLSLAQDCYQPFFEEGVKAYNALDFERAINQFKAANICDDAPANDKVGEWISKAQNGYIDAIKKARDKALVLQIDTEALNYFSSGQEQECKGFFQEAFDSFSDAIKLRSKIIKYRERRAELALNEEIKAYSVAIEDLGFLIENGKEDKLPGYYESMAYAREQLGDFTGAVVAQNNAASRIEDFEQRDIYESKLTRLKYKTGEITVLEPSPDDKDSSAVSAIHNSEVLERTLIKVKNEDAGCDLNIQLEIDGEPFELRKNSIEISRLKSGTYQYNISGSISCPSTNSWAAIGKGTITVRSNAVYYLYWKENKYGKCEMWLSNF
ncbi:MAG: hypothetical protein ACI8X3_000984 [Saprospiraceae bacterium]|jgi:hypothetical protein